MSERLKYSTKERRKSWRLPTLGTIIISRVDSSNTYEGKMFNISKDGMKCATDLRLNTTNPVDIKVEKSADLRRNKRHRGEVIWKTFNEGLNHGTYLYGIKFIFPSSMNNP